MGDSNDLLQQIRTVQWSQERYRYATLLVELR